MPVARTDPRRALGAAIAVVVAALLLVGLTVWISGRGTSSGDGQFDTLFVADLLDRQARENVPSCFNDPVDGRRPICVFHTGDDPDEGWVAYDAQVDGCAFEALSPEATELVNSCTGETYPFTGEGLAQYATEVEDDRLVIDLDGAEPETTTTTTVVQSGEVPD